jgi:hypothetical protein
MTVVRGKGWLSEIYLKEPTQKSPRQRSIDVAYP